MLDFPESASIVAVGSMAGGNTLVHNAGVGKVGYLVEPAVGVRHDRAILAAVVADPVPTS